MKKDSIWSSAFLTKFGPSNSESALETIGSLFPAHLTKGRIINVLGDVILFSDNHQLIICQFSTLVSKSKVVQHNLLIFLSKEKWSTWLWKKCFWNWLWKPVEKNQWNDGSSHVSDSFFWLQWKECLIQISQSHHSCSEGGF